MYRLPAEWHPHLFTQLTWPHADTDWKPVLADAIDCFCDIAREVAKREPLIIVAQYPEQTSEELNEHGVSLDNITIVECATNDTWVRDHAFITTVVDGLDMFSDEKKGGVVLNDYQFNGWGLKFAADNDNLINSRIFPFLKSFYQQHGRVVEYRDRCRFVLEGGSIESDGEGTLMVTESCLLSDNRNNVTRQEAEEELKSSLGAKRVLWLRHSWLAGDDTDGHIDTLARFCTPTTIAYVRCDDATDEHYEILAAMERELKAFRTADGQPYELMPLPLPKPCYGDEGERLPATYANFYIMNEAVLVPTYGQSDCDAEAMRQLQRAFPDREVVGIDCRILIIQHGSLHCSTMQYV